MQPTTQQIIEKQRRTGVHAAQATPEGWVSSRSVWSHDIWFLDAKNSRTRDSHTSVKWVGLSPPVANVLKVLAWSLLVSRPHGSKPLEAPSATPLGVRLQHLGRWMMKHGHRSFGSLSPAAVASYRDHVKEEVRRREREREDDLAPGTVASYFLPLQYAYEQRRHFEALNLAPLPDDPFPESSAYAAAEAITADVERFVPPIPDEVVLPVVRAAHDYLGRPAEDILRLQDACLKLRMGKGGLSDEVINRRIRAELVAFEFGCRDGEEDRWHPPLAQFWTEGTRETPFNHVRQLLCDLMIACLTIVRFHAGMRTGELFTFQPGRRADGLPKCVEVEQSLSGAYDLFFVAGEVSKGWDHPERTRWLLGSRPSGETELPDVVRALAILDRLAEPWRAWSKDPRVRNAFLVQFGMRGIARRADLIAPLASDTMGELAKDFVERNLDVRTLDPEDETLAPYIRSRGRCVQGKQWRKTWANFMIRSDRRLLPAIAQQFQHASTAITEAHYIGKDPVQLGLVENAAMEKALSFISEAMDGGDGTGGRVRQVLRDELRPIHERVEGLSRDAKSAAYRAWFVERDIRIFLAPHGKCFAGLLPGENRCHEEAGTTDWSNQAPDFLVRNPRLCSGCKCFGIDREDIPFWARRYLENRRIWREATERDMQVNYTVARERWMQSEALLRSLGVEPQTLEGDA